MRKELKHKKPQEAIMAKPKRKPTTPQMVDYTKMTPKQLIVSFNGTKSAAIRGLAAEGFKTTEIAKMLDIIYQHARNVLTRPLKRVTKT